MTDNRYAIQNPSLGAPTAEGFLLAQTWTNSIAVPFMQNVLGGLGVGLLAFIGGIVSELEPIMAGKVALIIGGSVFGIAMIIRAFRDEVRFVVTIIAQARDRATQEALHREIVALTAEIERIKTAGLLSNRYAAQAAAEQLLFDHFKQLAPIARRAADKRGMSRPAWDAGTKLLKEAGALTDKGMVAPSYTAGMAALLRHLATSRQFVRTADGDFAQV